MLEETVAFIGLSLGMVLITNNIFAFPEIFGLSCREACEITLYSLHMLCIVFV